MRFTKNIPGINPMFLGAPWGGACLEPQQMKKLFDVYK